MITLVDLIFDLRNVHATELSKLKTYFIKEHKNENVMLGKED